MIWLGILCLLLAAALAGYVAATERQMRALAEALAARGRDLRRVRLRFPTKAARALAQEANGLIDEVDAARLGAAEERRELQRNLATFSHDVRTPLAGAQGYLQLYAMAESDAERDECVTAAAERLSAMRVLVDQLFEYAKAASDDRELACEPVNAVDVLGECLAVLYPSFVERGWEPEVVADGAVVVLADREALMRIVENVLGNCLRHGSAAPRIELRRRGGSGCDLADGGRGFAAGGKGSCACGGSRRGGFALSISNEAEGLEALDVPRLFERFYRGDAARSAGGSGLGLSIAADLARAMDMGLEATAGEGRFTVTLWKE